MVIIVFYVSDDDSDMDIFVMFFEEDGSLVFIKKLYSYINR